ncbi:MAG: sigma-54-dependent Fis family transcriptional regulator [Proteobacteria bacterium]|nr:sigma-54-dependent Fis family transcriptional regulator [Pseudomonadota bacterium]
MSNPQVLVVDDELDIRTLLQEILSEEGYQVTVAADADEARAAWVDDKPDLVLLDIWMPGTDGITLLREWSDGKPLACPVVMMSGHGTVETAVEATRLGAFDFVEKPLSLAELLRTVERAINEGQSVRPHSKMKVPDMVAPIGKSKEMKALRDQAQKLAPHDTPVLLLGEAGTGREAFARYIHAMSPRAASPFVTITGGSLRPDQAAQKLFGNQKGSDVSAGAFEKANNGTLFINELGDLDPEVQTMLLGALEQGSFQRIGSDTDISLSLRLLSSADSNLDLSKNGPVRTDLLALLNVVQLHVPPLREYAEDVPDLLRYYVDKLVNSEGLPYRRFGVAAQNRLRNYPWLGNVRELRNLVQRHLIMSNEEEISLEEIENDIAAQPASNEPLVKQDLLALPLREAREQFEKAYLQQQLILCGGKVGLLAKRVGMERTHLYRKLRTLGVEFSKGRDE